MAVLRAKPALMNGQLAKWPSLSGQLLVVMEMIVDLEQRWVKLDSRVCSVVNFEAKPRERPSWVITA